MPKEVEIAYKMYKCRDAVSRLFPTTWREGVKPWQHMIKQIAKRRKIGLLEAAALMAEEGVRTFDGPAQMWTWAAVAELIEPSETPPGSPTTLAG